ncbi:MAG: hypothetical protein MJD61_10165 [Proteobacteria bacterium]|nr:hypothetical protein [Pseudomonadota bacterium]
MNARAKKLLEEFQHLPANEQRWLKRQLAAVRPDTDPPKQDSEADESEEHPGDEQRRRAAMQGWLEMAGTGHSEHTDVSENKYRHLAEAYATKP